LVQSKRLGYGTEPIIPHNLTMTITGTGLLWFGWFGFNAGSAVSAGALAASAFVATHFAAAAATLSWTFAEWIWKGKPSALGAVSGAVAGLVAITPASGYVGPMASLVIGGVAVWCVSGRLTPKTLGYDDSWMPECTELAAPWELFYRGICYKIYQPWCRRTAARKSWPDVESDGCRGRHLALQS
jgi:Amt family ammonium transporter